MASGQTDSLVGDDDVVDDVPLQQRDDQRGRRVEQRPGEGDDHVALEPPAVPRQPPQPARLVGRLQPVQSALPVLASAVLTGPVWLRPSLNATPRRSLPSAWLLRPQATPSQSSVTPEKHNSFPELTIFSARQARAGPGDRPARAMAGGRPFQQRMTKALNPVAAQSVPRSPGSLVYTWSPDLASRATVASTTSFVRVAPSEFAGPVPVFSGDRPYLTMPKCLGEPRLPGAVAPEPGRSTLGLVRTGSPIRRASWIFCMHVTVVSFKGDECARVEDQCGHASRIPRTRP